MAKRSSNYPVDALFLDRWSPRAFDGSQMPEHDLLTMFESARWAPSAFNYQPWRFVYAETGTAEFDRFCGLLMPFNSVWAQKASVLIFVLSDTLIRTKPEAPEVVSHSHSFDAGAAWAMLALQATRLGYHAHGMTGADFARAREVLEAPERFRFEAAVAIGRLGDPAKLPDSLRSREVPSLRKNMDDLVFKGRFSATETS